MSLFSLSDIKFSSPVKRTYRADTQTNYRFPLDLGNADKGHYVCFFVNTQEKTSFNRGTGTGTPTVFSNRQRLGTSNLGGTINNSVTVGDAVVNTVKETIGNNPTISGALNTIFGSSIGQQITGLATTLFNGAKGATLPINNVNFMRTIKRSADTIALYMPNTLNFAQQQGYNDLNLSGVVSGTLAAGTSIIDNLKKGGTLESTMKNLTPFIGEALRKGLGTGNIGDAVFTSLFGAVTNPQLELIYTTPSFRVFSFEFNFYPRSEQEAETVQRIIQLFKFHQSPELLAGTSGYFLVPPSEFDIEFYYNGNVNPNIPKISTCVLQGINVDYAPNGFQAYESQTSVPEIGKTGMPVGIRMTLNFKETEIMTKYNFNPGDNGWSI